MLVPYDPAWPELFEAFARDLRRHGDPRWVIEHNGSTAVPGMPAKPIIDLAVRVDDEQQGGDERRALEAAGWRAGSAVRTHPVLVFERDGIRSAIAHFFPARAWESVNQRLFRDWLRTHPDDAARYAAVKQDAAAAAERGEATYNDAKSAIVQLIVDRAREARHLPRVSVSDK